MKRIMFVVVGAYLALVLLAGCFQRKLLYFPSHIESTKLAVGTPLTEWRINNQYVGWARVVSPSSRTWLFVHGNGGQAVHRQYALHCFDAQDNVYILEYPGYGNREGSPSQGAFNAAAQEAYDWLAKQYPQGVAVFGESLGSGVACYLANSLPAPKRIVLVVPFDKLTDVAQEKIKFLPVKLIMLDRWDNIEALKTYTGQIDIYGASDDGVIPIDHARKLAASKPGVIFHEIASDHNGWSREFNVDLRNP